MNDYVIKIKTDRIVCDHIKSYWIRGNELIIHIDGYSFTYLSFEVNISEVVKDLDNYFRIISEH